MIFLKQDNNYIYSINWFTKVSTFLFKHYSTKLVIFSIEIIIIYQSIRYIHEKVERFQSETDVLPVRVDRNARHRVTPGQVIVVTPVEHGTCRRGRADTRCQKVVQTVTIVTDADLKFDGGIDSAYHGRIQEGRVELVFLTMHEFLNINTS